MASTPVRVLLVDDHPVMRDGLQQLLERTGEFEVVGHAGDGEEAERVAKEVVPDLVIMDVLMPGRDGIDACREIIDALEDVRVLMLTATTQGQPSFGGCPCTSMCAALFCCPEIPWLAEGSSIFRLQVVAAAGLSSYKPRNPAPGECDCPGIRCLQPLTWLPIW